MTKTFPEAPLNPYELRFEMLKLARNILTHNARIAVDHPMPEGTEVKVLFTAEDVIETARKLNEFVSNKGESDTPKPQRCPRCKIGIDTDGDGNCFVCGHLSDEEVAQGIVPGPTHLRPIPNPAP